MKSKFIKPIVLFVLSMMMGINMATAQIGPVVSVSETEKSLPADIKTFVNKYFPGATMTEIQLKTLDGIYKIKINNGYSLKFQTSGQWLEIDAPKVAMLSTTMVTDLLPAESVKHLTDRGVIPRITELTFKPHLGYKAEVAKSQDQEKNFDFGLEV